MDSPTRAQYGKLVQSQKLQLKEWESTWRSSHGGSKPTRDDISRNPDIAAKYKRYQRTRDILSGKIPLSSSHSQGRYKQSHSTADNENKENAPFLQSSKRKPSSQLMGTTPSKRSKSMHTPSNLRTADMLGDDALTTPSISRKLFSPAVPTSIGPTPHRDGKVLGLFDLLNQELAEAETAAAHAADSATTPSKSTSASNRKKKGAGQDPSLLTTPSKSFGGGKSRPEDVSDLEEDNPKLGKTPMSSGRRAYFNMLVTPSKPKNLPQNNGYEETLEDGSLSNIFHTPECLRRYPTQSLTGAVYKSPSMVRLPRKPMGKTLSSLVAGLRQIEDEKLDDDMDLMREMEGGPTASKFNPLGTDPANKPTPNAEAEAEDNGTKKSQDIPSETVVKDSQPALLGGFDNESDYDSPVSNAQQMDRGRPLKIYKKKGQKRTTRKVNMRPTRSKRPINLAEPEDETDSEDRDVVPETRYGSFKENAAPDPEVENLVGEESGSEFDKDLDDDEKPKSKPKKSTESTTTTAAKRGRGRPKGSTSKAKGNTTGEERAADKPEGKIKKAARKVNELAHANFRALKLRNKGNKSGPGHSSRFRRRR
ncbi:DNA replication regulator SLD2 [Zalerion maritima]|uniref:DNA replication regulator SLD2 n=1 Tax=Zalerion maritima TaxID=339359 RepID=A0AAD5WXR4_9PEZI|nr:DNA replication regulator SLD2 [Zalerion maritima]